MLNKEAVIKNPFFLPPIPPKGGVKNMQYFNKSHLGVPIAIGIGVIKIENEFSKQLQK
jgi:hypothetical protein